MSINKTEEQLKRYDETHMGIYHNMIFERKRKIFQVVRS